MGLLNNLRNKTIGRLSELSTVTTTSGTEKEMFRDWVAMTEEQGGYFSAFTMSKNLAGAALAFRCRPDDPARLFCLSISRKSDKHLFDMNGMYKARIQFDNSIVIYAHLNAYKEKHAIILGVADQLMEHLNDSSSLKIEFIGKGKKKFTARFSLKGAADAVNATMARREIDSDDIAPWFLRTGSLPAMPAAARETQG